MTFIVKATKIIEEIMNINSKNKRILNKNKKRKRLFRMCIYKIKIIHL